MFVMGHFFANDDSSQLLAQCEMMKLGEHQCFWSDRGLQPEVFGLIIFVGFHIVGRQMVHSICFDLKALH